MILRATTPRPPFLRGNLMCEAIPQSGLLRFVFIVEGRAQVVPWNNYSSVWRVPSAKIAERNRESTDAATNLKNNGGGTRIRTGDNGFAERNDEED